MARVSARVVQWRAFRRVLFNGARFGARGMMAGDRGQRAG
jgi:hypothetical protein